ncbi:helix-turn-helix domain-containing protein [Oryzifoliimicrobium ureilyticus]|uniref:helix-turn-helix domain-containing protein n=1 Tax=Oryzifoliimicrobium ureilyticus TaxID=3113724 RepID=UPI003F67E118
MTQDLHILVGKQGESTKFAYYRRFLMLPVQCRMARAALGLKIAELADLAKMSTNTIVRFEKGKELKQSTIDDLRLVLENAGIVFIPENGDGPGVRLKKSGS